eukprot:5400803-Alexandrium_andersonii.AAC.1
MSASLVGSEMCIRDRFCGASWWGGLGSCSPPSACPARAPLEASSRGACAVSYTHLTLPTICSV